VAAPERESVSVEEDDSRDLVGGGESCCGRDARAERVTDEDRAVQVEAVFEGVEELEPVGHRVGAAALAVAEGRQVEGEDAVAGTGEEWSHVVPDPGRLGGAAEEHHRRSRAAPAPFAIGQECPVGSHERPAVERGRGPLPAVRREVVDECGDGEPGDDDEQRERQPAGPAT
jgi:hypothetical protein